MVRTNRKRIRKRTVPVFLLAVLFLSFGVYIVSERRLRSQMTTPIKRDNVDFSKVLDWLPQKTKVELEYRAKYLTLKKKYDTSVKIPEVIQNAYELAMHTRDIPERYEIMSKIVFNKSYRSKKGAYMAYSDLLMDPAYPKHLTIPEYHQFIAEIQDPEDQFFAWKLGRDKLKKLKMKPEIIMEYLKPITTWEVLPCKDYLTFYIDLEGNAKRVGDMKTFRMANDIKLMLYKNGEIREIKRIMDDRKRAVERLKR